jgi:hypothetical protein
VVDTAGYSTLKIEAAGFSKNVVNFYHCTRLDILYFDVSDMKPGSNTFAL